MNDIVNKQNTDLSISQLAAQRALYSSAKRFLTAQFIFSVPIAVLIAFSALALDKEWFSLPKRDITWFVGLSSLSFLLIELVLNPVMNKRKETAAKIQQSFDSNVLGLSTCEITYGKLPDPEKTVVWAQKCFDRGVPRKEFKNWYRVEVADLPMNIARIICQRSNCWWDEDIRRFYNGLIWAVGCILFAVIVAIVLRLDCTATMFFGLVVPLFIPFITVASKVIQDNNDAIARLGVMKEAINDAWQNILRNRITDDELVKLANVIQTGIYNNRKNNPLVFDWIHKRFKARHEAALSKSTEIYVEEFKRSRESLLNNVVR